jgi:hypothetical protein
MKYEMIFGDESLFDGAPDGAEYVGWFCQEVRWYMVLNGKILFSDGGSWCTSDNPYLSADIAAMRRIIKEPKRWTWEDKKAGRLPGVGSIVKFGKSEIEFLGVGEISNYWVCRYPSGVFAFRERGSIKPIETPAEKSQREEDEFVDALVSGYNKMPSSISFKAGIRAAYRKMRGGE